MKIRPTYFLLMPILFALLGGCAGKAPPTTDWGKLPEFNEIVLRVAETHPTDGTNDYWWPKKGEYQYDGVSRDMYLDGVRVMKGEPGGNTYCCGFTLQVFLEAYYVYRERYGERIETPLVPEQWDTFQSLWFVREINGPGPSAALEQFGMGREIAMEDAVPGDFIQIWRRWDPKKKEHGSGHSVIFLDWVKNRKGEIRGIRYLSTQPGTDGISENIEYFGAPNEKEGVAEEYTHWARVDIPVRE